MMKFLKLNGQEARRYTKELAELRLKVFWDFPYLYEGTLDYEISYLETYFKSNHSFILIAEDHGKIVGASTAIWGPEADDSFRMAFEKVGLLPNDICYFGESVLLPDYRGRGIGKIFFRERENFAKSLPSVRMLSFCAVEREDHHPMRPSSYRPLNNFWENLGFHKMLGLQANYEWPDRGDAESTVKKMQFWIKHLREDKP